MACHLMGGVSGYKSQFRRDQARTKVPGGRRLDEYFTIDWQKMPNKEKAQIELWAWHWYFLHGRASKQAKKAYRASLAAIRERGDLEGSIKAWEGVDFDKLHRAFKKSVKDW